MPTMRPRFQWDLGRRLLPLGERTLIMGVLNVTPDSFSDGGRYLDPQAAIAHGLSLLDQGADILDLGGESTRPGAPAAVSAQQELDRILPVLEALRRERPSAILSIDTYKSAVARAALDAGADIINDVSGLTWDAEMSATLAQRRCGVILMHTRGRPGQWAGLPPVPDLLPLVLDELGARVAAALQAGIARQSIVVDPGFGFGKRLDENYPLLARFDEFHALGFPLLAALSRKGFLAHTLAARRAGLAAAGGEERAALSFAAAAGSGQPPIPPASRDTLTLAATVAAALAGAHIVRVHAVAGAVEALAIADAILQART
jgi:dihydropteroate synthase